MNIPGFCLDYGNPEYLGIGICFLVAVCGAGSTISCEDGFFFQPYAALVSHCQAYAYQNPNIGEFLLKFGVFP